MSSLALVGHEATIQQLERALARGRLGHSFLFVGPSGIGKRTAAISIAQGLLCTGKTDRTFKGCGRCHDCTQIAEGTHPDLLLAAKPADKHELPIQTMTELCASLALKPARGRWKIAVVDDADLLNEESANCFLKTLEEPPPGSLLILIATSVEMQLKTILSRCQIMRFRELDDNAVSRILLDQELVAEPDEARRIAALGRGSVERALAMAEPMWTDFRSRLARGLAQLPSGSVDLAADVQSFVEDAGKEAPLRRRRTKEVIRLAIEILQEELHSPARRSAQIVVDLLERSLEADAQVSRFLNLVLVIDTWIDDLGQIAAETFIPPVHGLRGI